MKPLIVFGTRPECIKIISTIHELDNRHIPYIVCVTSQHKEMLAPFLDFFNIRVDYDLGVMKSGQDLYHVTTETMLGLRKILRDERPDITITQGDTTTAFSSALASFYEGIPIAHIEAGLRTFDLNNPFPEEMNRRLIDHLSSWHFAPTHSAVQNLAAEGLTGSRTILTGNTVIDAISLITRDERFQNLSPALRVESENRLILVTAHRRESFGEKFENLCNAMLEIVRNNENVEIVYPVHLNPNVREPVFRILKENSRIHLIEPLDYLPFLKMMQQADLILTDSGGVQEEAPSLRKPVLIMRETTERLEGVELGMARIVGTDLQRIVKCTQEFLDDPSTSRRALNGHNPYGDGQAAKRIVDALTL